VRPGPDLVRKGGRKVRDTEMRVHW
jgi:hypothetical protein